MAITSKATVGKVSAPVGYKTQPRTRSNVTSKASTNVADAGLAAASLLTSKDRTKTKYVVTENRTYNGANL